MNTQFTYARQQPHRVYSTARSAFTLVELLVVITIIGILVALLIPAVTGVMGNAKDAQMGIEIASMSQALEAYKLEHLEYPPDFARPSTGDLQQINEHLARKFRYRVTKGKPNDNLVALNGQLPSNLDPAEALVFWLSGPSGDPKFPLTGRKPENRDSSTGGGAREKGPNPFFEFDQARLLDQDGDGFPEYYPDYSELPYVYLRHDSYLKNADNPMEPHLVREGPDTSLGGPAPVRAYAANIAEGQYVAAEKFQIICAGRDNRYMNIDVPSIPEYPSGIGYQEQDEDNLTNFSEGETLRAAIP